MQCGSRLFLGQSAAAFFYFLPNRALSNAKPVSEPLPFFFLVMLVEKAAIAVLFHKLFCFFIDILPFQLFPPFPLQITIIPAFR
jgi:hypothetical protein